ncbi:MAG: class I SAM-dependent methyltransferase [Methanospirillaceae archaeon]|nr:class I SAM-dependent methyltransferase [Methanospirillaceae archaeon]
MKFYDSYHKRLVFIKKQASPEFWDEHWNRNKVREDFISGESDYFITRNTKKFLPSGKILEGGSGTGKNVFSLQKNGYDAIGVDYAELTVKRAYLFLPNLNILPADVRYLPFHSSIFDGYWSIGVIEHFFTGYDEIADEMKRVLKPGGYLFLSFPYMSPLRRIKAKSGLYLPWDESHGITMFYQFALNAEEVILAYEKRGFKVLKKIPYDGIKGLKDEIKALRPFLQYIYDSPGNCRIMQMIQYILNLFLIPITGHMMVLILQKEDVPD